MPHRVQEAPLQILCEGQDDMEFFSRLARERGLNNYQSACPRGIDGRCVGKDGFAKHLELIQQQVPSGVALKGVLIVADSDESPETSFRNVLKSLRKANLPYPEAPLKIRKTHSAPAIAVMMVPWHDRKGNLETVVGQALKQRFPSLISCIDAYCNCCQANAREESTLDKMHLRCLIAALHETDPSISLAYFLKKSFEVCPIDYHCDLFNPMAGFLGAFAAEALGLLLGPAPS